LIATSGAAAIWLFCDKIIGSAELAEVARASAMNIARLMTDLHGRYMAPTPYLNDFHKCLRRVKKASGERC
jgi:hypothetical protein